MEAGERKRGFFSWASKFRQRPFEFLRRRMTGKNVGLLFHHHLLLLPPHTLSHTHTHLQVTEQQERVVDLDVEVVPASSLGHERAGEDEEVEGQKKGGSSNKETFDGTSARFFFGSKKKKKVEPFSAACDESKEPGGLKSVCERRVLRSRARGQEM